MSIDIVFTLPVAANPGRPDGISSVEWGAAPGPTADPMVLEEIEGSLLEAGFDGFFTENIPGAPPRLHLVLQDPDEALEKRLTGIVTQLGCEPVGRTEKPAIDWIKNWVDTLTAFELVPGFWVNPRPDRELTVPAGARVLRVVPGFAFGTGHHATTRLASTLLAKDLRPGASVLDVGCGTAILALLAKGLGAGTTWACDHDPSAVARAAETIADNGNPEIRLFVSDLLHQVPPGQVFDRVVANIISDILVRLLGDERLLGLLAPQGDLILSGIHTEGKADVTEALTRRGLVVREWVSEDGWWGLRAERG